MVIETDGQTLQFALMSPDLDLHQDALVKISNLQRAPHLSVDGQPAALKEHESKLIDQLLDVCSYYCDKGDTNLAELVDKIGIALMQSFLARSGSTTSQPIGNGGSE